MRATLLAFLVVTPVVVFLSCSDKKDSSGGGGGAKEEPVTAGSLAVVTGTIQPAEGADVSTVAGALVEAEGHPEISAVTDENGNFGIENVLPGTIALYVGSNDGGAAALKLEEGKGIGPTAYGLKIPDVVLKSGAVTDLGEQALKKTGGFSGKVVFYSNPNNLDLTGSEVFVPGTGFIVKTDAAGAFSLGGLPPGKYSIRAQHTGFAVLDVKDVEVLEGQTSDIGNLALSISTGPEGKIEVVEDLTAAIGDNKAAKIVKTKSVKLKLSYDSDAALMKVADEPSFTNKEWVPVSTSVDWPPFKTDGLKSLYVMFSDLNGLESSPYKDEVYVDTEAPVLTSALILNDWVMTAKKEVFVDTVGTDTGSGITEIMTSEVSDNFNHDETWKKFKPRTDFEFSSSTSGNRTIYVRVRDYAGRISNVVSDDITKGSSTKITAKDYDQPITLFKAQSPYLIHDGAPPTTFSAAVTIEAGVQVEIPDMNSVSFKNKVLANGTAALPVVFHGVDGGMCQGAVAFDEGLPGASSKTEATYLTFLDLQSVNFNGGTFTHSKFKGCGGTSYKTGEDRLLLDQPVFENWGYGMLASNGIDATTIKNGSGSLSVLFRQETAATKSKIIGGSYTFNGSVQPAVIDIKKGDITLDGLTLSPDSGQVAVLSESPGVVTVKNININTVCNTAFRLEGGDIGKILVTGGTITGCGYGAENNGGVGSLVSISNATLDLPYSAAVAMNASGEDVVFDHNNITVAEAVARVDAASSKMTFTNNNIDCINTIGVCDILAARQAVDAAVAHSFTLTGNNINCPNSTGPTAGIGCRGFFFARTVGTGQSVVMTLSLDGNFWEGGRDLVSDLTALEMSDGTSVPFPANDVMGYKGAFAGAGSLSFALVPDVTTITNAGSSFGNAGP